MKKFLIALSALAFLTGCTMDTSEQETNSVATKMLQQPQTILFTATQDASYKITLTSKDLFKTAVLIDANGKKHSLKRDASGVYLVSKDGIKIIFSKGVGYLTPAKGAKEIKLQYVE
ncbi:hypothetical protein LMG7974_01416 [Campylobacter majalis]|uniref:Type IV secretion system putative lipoprotein virB7 n=1 Tax=Campylobacter majalis TaxID=2790656 RepID=A0ABN7K9R0_9BACT|nr:lipoprotein [Campylobacter majalis]CAD7289251.1 hypothetical protein LMG7974_01416 [Campylobacter majalis]